MQGEDVIGSCFIFFDVLLLLMFVTCLFLEDDSFATFDRYRVLYVFSLPSH